MNISALLMYFDEIIDELNVCLLMLDCEFSVSQWLNPLFSQPSDTLR